MKNLSLIALIVSLGAQCALAEDAQMKVKPAVNVPPEVKIGARPYEMEGRREDRVPLFGFEDLAGWTVQSLDGADAELVRTREQQMWGEYVGKLTYKGKSDGGRVIVRPAKPIPVSGEFDCIGMWVYGNLWEWAPDPGTPFLDVSILVRDASGKEQGIALTRVRWKEWWLTHKKLGEAMRGMEFSGIEVRGINNAEPRSIFLDSLYFYREELKPLEFEPRPARNLTPFEGQGQGTNTGPGRLPFPTREETILPTNFEGKFSNTVKETSPGVYRFSYKAKDGEVKYIYKPAKGGLGEIAAFVNGKEVGAPMAGGGIELGGKLPEGKLVSSALNDGIVAAVFDFGGTKAEYRLRIWRKSLVIDFVCRGGKATGVALGEARGIAEPKLVLIPYLTFGASNPRVLCTRNGGKPVFTSAWVDWYRSNGSELWSQEWVQETSAKFNGGVRYHAKTDGTRNDLYERVFLTVSPTFEETLPTIANPPPPHGLAAGERLWQESWGPENYDKEHERSKMLRSYGIEKLTQCNHEITWRDGGESFTTRTKAAPGRGGDKALKEYVAKQKSLGWLSGLYTNYCDFAPVNEFWDPDYVQRTADGEMRPGWPRCYALKPSRAVELDAKLAKQVQAKFGSNAAYTDVHTAVSPWMYCDYDARVPGAGTFASTFYAYGELLLNDQKVYGPIWSEGTYHWLYAGLATGNYALMYTGVDLAKEPLNVAFDLMKIHPLECDIGMPWTGQFLKDASWNAPEKIDESIDHFIAATIAYGHIGWLVEEQYGIERTCRSYYMLQQLQKRYAMQKPVKIEYADEKGKWYSVSEAIANDVIRDSRLHVVYENGLEVWVNGSLMNWRAGDERRSLLPPWGYAASLRGIFEERSALVGGRRVDYSRSVGEVYQDSRGVPLPGQIGARGSVLARYSRAGIEIIDIHGNDQIGLGVATPKGCLEHPTSAECTAYDADGKELGQVPLRFAQNETAWFTVREGARRYVIRNVRETRKQKVYLDFGGSNVAPGERLTAKVGSSSEVPIRSASFEFEGSKSAKVRKPGLDRRNLELPVTFPNDIKPGDWLWVKASVTFKDGTVEEIWNVFAVVPAFALALHETGDSRFSLDITNNLRGGPEPVVSARMKDGSVITASQSASDPLTIEMSSPLRPSGVSDTLAVQVSSGNATAAREFAVRAYRDYPSTWHLNTARGFVTGYCVRGGKENPGITTTGGGFYRERLACGGVAKESIFAHPPYIGGVGYSFGVSEPIAVPEKPSEFRTFIGLKDGGNPSDGVVFTVLSIEDDGTEHQLVKEHWGKREWKEVTADLSALKGKSIRLKFVTDVGPKDDATADWAAWGEPRVVTKEPMMRVEVGTE